MGKVPYPLCAVAVDPDRISWTLYPLSEPGVPTWILLSATIWEGELECILQIPNGRRAVDLPSNNRGAPMDQELLPQAPTRYWTDDAGKSGASIIGVSSNSNTRFHENMG
jgi:hypothetical protein